MNENKETKESLLQVEARSPSCMSVHLMEVDNKLLTVYLVADGKIGYYRDEIDQSYCSDPDIVVELCVQEDNHIEFLNEVRFDESFVESYRNQNGKLDRKALRKLGVHAALDKCIDL